MEAPGILKHEEVHKEEKKEEAEGVGEDLVDQKC